jgi:hypothetical protein
MKNEQERIMEWLKWLVDLTICWECSCGWLLSDTAKKHIKYDFGCPRCKTPFAEFNPKFYWSRVPLSEANES